jgi:Fic family protein
MERFEHVYAALGAIDSIIAAATAHHRLLWIHPFTDGNGRVARLMSHAMLRDALETGGIWSIARGLARRESEYKEHLERCDELRHGDLDGRGNLSTACLADFAEFFLRVCLDQITFMASLVQPDRLRKRVVLWTQDEIRKKTLPASSPFYAKPLAPAQRPHTHGLPVLRKHIHLSKEFPEAFLTG